MQITEDSILICPNVTVKSFSILLQPIPCLLVEISTGSRLIVSFEMFQLIDIYVLHLIFVWTHFLHLHSINS